jgi:hypothetical protein
MWAQRVATPLPWSIFTYWPQLPLHSTSVTTPGAVATIEEP